MSVFSKFKKKEAADDISLSKMQNEANRKRILSDGTSFDVRESYKELRTNITFSLSKKGCKTILVTSSIASEGKSTTCLNTAIAFAETGSKIVIIDCDMRKPNIAVLLNKSLNDKGLSNILVNDVDVDGAVVQSGFENLDVILAGNIPPNPAELLISDAMSSVIDELSKRYDYIFLDTPPVNVVTDAVLLSKHADGVVVVSRQDYTEKKFLSDSVSKLKFADAKIIGIVFNGIESTKTGYGRYGYGKYGYEAKTAEIQTAAESKGTE